jgi:hypothetical protein
VGVRGRVEIWESRFHLVAVSGRAEMWERVDPFGGCEGQGEDVGKSRSSLVGVRGRAEMWERADLVWWI